MKRRKFIYDSSLVALTIGVFGKIKWDGNAYVGEDPTTTDILGPFYRPGAPFRTDLVQKGTKGDILHFSGTIFSKDGKTPVKNALVEIWHCNESGEYDNRSDDYIYRASFKTSIDGKYNFRTIHPVPYMVNATQTRPAHIHMRISGAAEQDLVTQIYFKGDKYIPKDMSAGDPRSLHRILETSMNSKNEMMVKFNIVLSKAYTLDAASIQKVCGLYVMSDKTLCEFYPKGNELFLKVNGQIMEAMEYKGNNRFEGGLGQTKAGFEIDRNGDVKLEVTYYDDDNNLVKITGTKTLKYPS